MGILSAKVVDVCISRSTRLAAPFPNASPKPHNQSRALLTPHAPGHGTCCGSSSSKHVDPKPPDAYRSIATAPIGLSSTVMTAKDDGIRATNQDFIRYDQV